MDSLKLYQPLLAPELIDRINSKEPDAEATAAFRAHSEAFVFGNPEEALKLGLYQFVATIQTGSLSEAFEIGNIGPASRINKVNPRMHSVSVGNILMDSLGQAYVVEGVGFGVLKEELKSYLN